MIIDGLKTFIGFLFGLFLLNAVARADVGRGATCVERLAAGQNKFQTKLPKTALLKLASALQTQGSKVNSHALLVDYSRNSKDRRAFMIDFKRCEVVEADYVGHGGTVYKPKRVDSGDLDRDGMLDRCVKPDGSRKNMTRPGLYITGGCHLSKKDFPLIKGSCKGVKLHGLEKSNSDAYTSGVVLHEHVKLPNNGSIKPPGQGCPVFPKGRLQNLLRYGVMNEKTLVYVYAPQCR